MEIKKINKKSLIPGAWGALVGAIVITTVGFGWGGWMKGSTAKEMAAETAEEAVVDRLAEICVAQFKADPMKGQKLKDMKELKAWERSDFVKKAGWANMPGDKRPDDEVSIKCAQMVSKADL